MNEDNRIMTRHKTRLFVALCTVVVISVLSFERAGLLIAYRRLISDRSVKQKLRLLPKVSKLENSDNNSEVISLGYAEFHNTLGSIVSTSMERFPKIDIDFPTCEMTFLPPHGYGPSLRKWHEAQSEQHPEWYPKVSKKENAYLAGKYIDPYGFSKEIYATVPESLWKIAFFPKSKLRRSVYNLKQKSISTGQHYFFEGGDIKGIYALGSTSDPEHSLLRIYDVRTRLVQYVLITHKNSGERVDAIEQLVASFRFTVDTPPDEDLLYELVAGELKGSDASNSRNVWQQMEIQDQYLRSQFQKIKTGMSPAEVRSLMGVEPQVFRNDFWGFRLSPASNRSTERDITLCVSFKEGKVSKTDTSYTCIHTVPHQTRAP